MKRILLIQIGLYLLLTNAAFADTDLSEWAKYGESLQNCTPGTFNLPDPAQNVAPTNLPMINYEITGVENGICKVTITRTVEQEGQAPRVMKLNCAFKTDNLPTLSTSAREIAKGNISPDDPAGEIIRAACKQAT